LHFSFFTSQKTGSAARMTIRAGVLPGAAPTIRL